MPRLISYLKRYKKVQKFSCIFVSVRKMLKSKMISQVPRSNEINFWPREGSTFLYIVPILAKHQNLNFNKPLECETQISIPSLFKSLWTSNNLCTIFSTLLRKSKKTLPNIKSRSTKLLLSSLKRKINVKKKLWRISNKKYPSQINVPNWS